MSSKNLARAASESKRLGHASLLSRCPSCFQSAKRRALLHYFAVETPETKEDDEYQAHTDGRTDRRISRHLCADSFWPRRRGHGRPVSHEQCWRDDPRRLH